MIKKGVEPMFALKNYGLCNVVVLDFLGRSHTAFSASNLFYNLLQNSHCACVNCSGCSGCRFLWSHNLFGGYLVHEIDEQLAAADQNHKDEEDSTHAHHHQLDS